MPRAIEPFLCGCDCGEMVKSKAAEQRHLQGIGRLYIAQDYAMKHLHNTGSHSPSPQPDTPMFEDPPPPPLLDIDMDSDTESECDPGERHQEEMDCDESQELKEYVAGIGDDSDEEELDDADELAWWNAHAGPEDEWVSDEEDADDWDTGCEPWQEGLSQGDRLGAGFEEEAARTGAGMSFSS